MLVKTHGKTAQKITNDYLLTRKKENGLKGFEAIRHREW